MMITTQELPLNLAKLDRAIDAIKKCSDTLPEFWIAGGAVLSAITGDEINDYDVFSTSPQLLIEKLKAFSQAQVTYENPFFVNFLLYGMKIQVITRYMPIDPSELFDTFDFTVVCGAFDGQTFYCHERFWQDIATKRLVINAAPYPLKTMERLTKYAGRGYKPCPVGLLEVARKINEMEIDWNNPDENQLSFYPDGTVRFMGVD